MPAHLLSSPPAPDLMMPEAPSRCLIFDLDGTLVDSLPGIATALNQALADHQLPTHPEVAVRRFVGNGLEMLLRRAAPANSPETLISALMASFKSHYQQGWSTGTIPYPGIPGLLESLQASGFQLAVLSNKTHPFTQLIVHRLFPEIRFVAVLGQRDEVPRKPAPDGAEEIARIAGVPTSACTLIGDSTVDLATAANAGMSAVAVSWGYHDSEQLRAAGADWLATSAEELLTHLSQFTPA